MFRSYERIYRNARLPEGMVWVKKKLFKIAINNYLQLCVAAVYVYICITLLWRDCEIAHVHLNKYCYLLLLTKYLIQMLFFVTASMPFFIHWWIRNHSLSCSVQNGNFPLIVDQGFLESLEWVLYFILLFLLYREMKLDMLK